MAVAVAVVVAVAAGGSAIGVDDVVVMMACWVVVVSQSDTPPVQLALKRELGICAQQLWAATVGSNCGQLQLHFDCTLTAL